MLALDYCPRQEAEALVTMEMLAQPVPMVADGERGGELAEMKGRVCDIVSRLLSGLGERLRVRWPPASPVALMAGVWPLAQRGLTAKRQTQS